MPARRLEACCYHWFGTKLVIPDNINYDSLKRTIKVHTTKGQASAITIPGHQASALEKFENDLYLQLKFEHDRTGRFVALKATEIGWRLRRDPLHYRYRCVPRRMFLLISFPEKHSNDVQAFIVRCSRRGLTQKRLLQFAKHERALAECSDEISALSRFVNAQKVAFRKLLKKYKVGGHAVSLATPSCSRLTLCAEMDWVDIFGWPLQGPDLVRS